MRISRKGSLELSLNSITVFILSIMTFSAGIVIITAVLHNPAANPNKFINQCDSQLKEKLTQQNELFAVCPETITASPTELSKGIKVEAGFQNIDTNPMTFFTDKSHKPANAASGGITIAPLTFTVPANTYTTETFIIRMKDAQAHSGNTVYSRIIFCDTSPPSPGDYADCTPGSGTRSSLVTIKVK